MGSCRRRLLRPPTAPEAAALVGSRHPRPPSHRDRRSWWPLVPPSGRGRRLRVRPPEVPRDLHLLPSPYRERRVRRLPRLERVAAAAGLATAVRCFSAVAILLALIQFVLCVPACSEIMSTSSSVGDNLTGLNSVGRGSVLPAAEEVAEDGSSERTRQASLVELRRNWRRCWHLWRHRPRWRRSSHGRL